MTFVEAMSEIEAVSGPGVHVSLSVRCVRAGHCPREIEWTVIEVRDGNGIHFSGPTPESVIEKLRASRTGGKTDVGSIGTIEAERKP